MRFLVLALAIVLAASTRASADRADDLVTAGQKLAVAGRFEEAVAKFLEADAARPSALHACLIGLAWLRAGDLDGADREFAACRRRSTPADPVPAWLAVEEQRLADERRLAAERKAADERRLAAERKAAEDRRLAAERRAAAQRPPAETRPVVAMPAAAPRRASNLPLFLIAGGVGLGVVGGALHLGIVWPERKQLASAASGADYDSHYDRYNAARIATIGLYALGAASVAIGVVVHSRTGDTATLGVHPVDGGGVVTLGWRR